MKRIKLYRIGVEIIVALLILLFIYTGLNKMLDYEGFKFTMGRSPYLENWASFLAATLPAGEILLALLLMIPRSRLLGLYTSFGLMALFTGYIWLMLRFAYDLPCSCGGVLAALSWHDHLIFNAIYTILALIGIVLQTKLKQSLPGPQKLVMT